MKQDIQAKPDSGERRVMMEWMMGRYSDLSQDEIAELRHYLRKEASALDVGVLASNENIYRQYRRFVHEHKINRPGSIAWSVTGLLCATIIAVFLFAMVSP